MRSMTGFGSASKTRGEVSATVEARSVNNRFLKVSLRCPPSFSAREHEIEAIIRTHVERGTVYVVVRLSREHPEIRISLNEKVVADYRKLLKKLAKKAGAKGAPDLALLSRLPGVINAEEVESSVSKDTWNLVQETVGAALAKMVRMRDQEGANLKRDFGQRGKVIRRLVKSIKARAPKVVTEFGQRLEERVTALVEKRAEHARAVETR